MSRIKLSVSAQRARDLFPDEFVRRLEERMNGSLGEGDGYYDERLSEFTTWFGELRSQAAEDVVESHPETFRNPDEDICEPDWE